MSLGTPNGFFFVPEIKSIALAQFQAKFIFRGCSAIVLGIVTFKFSDWSLFCKQMSLP